MRAFAGRTLDGIKLPESLEPVRTHKRTIGESVWGRAWCAHLEGYSDFANRLPRGRTYLRNGSVWHLAIQPGRIYSLVRGTQLYEQTIEIRPLEPPQIRALADACAGQVDAAVDLVRGQLPAPVLASLRDPDRGLFPQANKIEMRCSCPDWARLCKHLAAVLYGVGLRLDAQPKLLFVLRGVEPDVLVQGVSEVVSSPSEGGEHRLRRTDLARLFDIEIDLSLGEGVARPPPGVTPEPEESPPRARSGRSRPKASAGRSRPKAAPRRQRKS